MTVAYEGCELHRSIGGVQENEYLETKNSDKNFYEYHQSGWIMPYSCIVLQFKNADLIPTVDPLLLTKVSHHDFSGDDKK